VVLLRERDEVSLTVPETAWAGSPLQRRAVAQAGPYRAITFDLDIALEVCGYLAPAAQRLAEAGIPIVPQCGYRKDHLLVLESQLATAVDVLEGLIGSCRS